MIKKIKQNVSFYWNSRKDWTTNERLVVIESDDWGSIRMPSKEVYDELLSLGFNLLGRPFERFDSIATNDDLNNLFDLLLEFKDINNNHPVITANVITANPNFEKIKKDNFKQYYREEFTDTLNRYDTDFNIWKKGIEKNVFFPQFHGREHLNVLNWLNSLTEKDSDDYIAFNLGMMGIPNRKKIDKGNVYQVAFNFDTNKNFQFLNNSINEGIDIFERKFKYKPVSFIAPVYTWDEEVEKILSSNKIEILQGGRYQILPTNKGKVKHYIGEKNNNFVYNVRNAFFEPSTIVEFDKRRESLYELQRRTERVFLNKNPLVISMHRLNFVGRIDVKNRDTNLILLRDYLKWLTKHYPDVKFLTTLELINLIKNENSHT